MRSILQPRTRLQWQLMHSMPPAWIPWSHQKEGSFQDFNQKSRNKDLWPQTAMSAFLHPFRSKRRKSHLQEHWSEELPQQDDIGRLIVNIVATDDFPPQRQERLKWPSFLSLGSENTVIDYTCRAKTAHFEHEMPFYPLLFAVQRDKCHLEANQQMAKAFRPMMTLFILYYLGTLTHSEEPMPEWMVLFGVVYSGKWLHETAYYPYFGPPTSVDKDCDWGWAMYFTGRFGGHHQQYIMRQEPWKRGPCIEVLYRIQAHCNCVLEHLRRWDGYEPTYKRIYGA
ncbi:hypothetical protein M408DRAFT_285603 [Serendipita vermifera MAFF 305830]|uniref:Uncharacterized protein n=1 Tax=Serendipita vermifera MAFF 305830 TaxID=933852 RepID=A0A0C3BE55_SERVB|nr:hypothetical protein M408DRAFT_285603 [Serendipita vermifera MAFF 305830]